MYHTVSQSKLEALLRSCTCTLGSSKPVTRYALMQVNVPQMNRKSFNWFDTARIEISKIYTLKWANSIYIFTPEFYMGSKCCWIKMLYEHDVRGGLGQVLQHCLLFFNGINENSLDVFKLLITFSDARNTKQKQNKTKNTARIIVTLTKHLSAQWQQLKARPFRPRVIFTPWFCLLVACHTLLQTLEWTDLSAPFAIKAWHISLYLLINMQINSWIMELT